MVTQFVCALKSLKVSFRILIGMRDKVRKGDRNGEKDEKL
jgi:hypothetical protein